MKVCQLKFLLPIIIITSTQSFHFNTLYTKTHYKNRNIELKAKVQKKKQSPPSNKKPTGFGGSAIQPCPCGSNAKNLPYKKCCGKIHNSLEGFIQATPGQIVQARYSALANSVIEFIIQSTHPENTSDYKKDVNEWKNILIEQGFDNFILTKCNILSETVEDDAASVTFEASFIRRDTKEKTSFTETSNFDRGENGAWLYKSGTVDSADE